MIIWTVVELLSSTADEGGSLIDLTLAPGARYKVVKSDELNLRYKFAHNPDAVLGLELSYSDPS